MMAKGSTGMYLDLLFMSSQEGKTKKICKTWRFCPIYISIKFKHPYHLICMADIIFPHLNVQD